MPFQLNCTTRPQFYRISQIDRSIKTGCYPNSRTLAEDLGVSRRTILRDVEFIKDSLNAPLDYCPRRRGYYYTEPEYSLGLINLTEGELLALYFGHSLLNRCRGTPFSQPAVQAFNKICSSLQDTFNTDFRQLSQFITFDLEPLRGDEQQTSSHFTTIGRAITAQKTIIINHYTITRDSCSTRRVDPYELRYYMGAWYLVGYCHLRREIRIFALDRIRNLEKTTLAFNRPKNFNAEDYFYDSFQLFKGTKIHQIKIWFSAEQSRWIKERQWHPTQVIKENPDGTIILTIQTSGLTQIKKWVLSFGSEAKVLAPPELVLSVTEGLSTALQLYKINKNT